MIKKKDKKGQVDVQIGVFLVLFVSIMVGVVLFQAAAQEVGRSTSTTVIANRTVASGVAGTVITLTDVKSISGVIITNTTSGTVITSTNYTVANNQVSNGNLVTTITVLAGANSAAGVNWNVSATYAEPTGYISDGAARQITNLIAIFFALGIAIVALTPTLRNGFLDAIGK